MSVRNDGVPSSPDDLPVRPVVVRFSHVDAAGIVFYPRYVEMFADAFPELAPLRPPFDLRMEFRKPTPLGEVLALAVASNDCGDGWRLSGASAGNEQFTMALASRAGPVPRIPEHELRLPAFRADGIRIHDWAAGPDGFLQLSRYYEFVNAAVEQWFEKSLGLPFRTLHTVKREGIPTVSLDTRCLRLPGIGADVDVRIRPVRVGSRSLTFDSWLTEAGECLIKTTQVIVYIKLEDEGFKSIALPHALRGSLARQLAEPGRG